MARVKKKARSLSRKYDTKYLGSEPEANDRRVSYALDWYNYFYTTSSGGMKFLKTYLRDNKETKKLKAIDALETWKVPMHICALARMKTRGWEFNEETDWDKSFNSTIEKLVTEGKEILALKTEEKNVYKPTIQDHMREAAGDIIAEYDEAIDEFHATNGKHKFSAYDYLNENDVKAPIAARVVTHFNPVRDELDLAIDGNAEVLEAYSGHKKTFLKKYRDFVNSLIKDTETWAENQKRTRKPRKKRAKSAVKQVSKVNFKERNDDLKIVSIDPTKIVGAQQLWIYNDKYKVLSVIYAASTNGLSVKGTTVQEFDPELSKGKTLRKPEEILPKVLKGGKIALRKIFDPLTTKEKKVTGRLNNETILLRVIK